MKMTHKEWMDLMSFPPQWVAWNLVPDELAAIQLSGYEPGQENASEHDRHGVFQWWLKQNPTKETLIKLARLTWLDPDPQMGQYVRECIGACGAADADVHTALTIPYAP